jgi:hypothetical protein
MALATAWVVALATVAAEEPPHLDLVRGLRDRGQADLAIEYLRKLRDRQQPPLPPEWKEIIPLELARCQVQLAERSASLSEREQLAQEAVRQLSALRDALARAQHPLLAPVLAELGRATYLAARVKVLEAEQMPARDRNRPARIGEAIALLDQAGKAFADASPQLEKAWKDLKDDPRDRKAAAAKQEALETYLSCLLWHGISLYEKATLLERTDLQKSADALRAASDILGQAATHRDRSPLGWQALAWQGRCWEGADDRRRDDAYERIMNEKRPEVVPAQRLVRYFRLVTQFKQGGDRAARSAMRQGLEKWLADYASGPGGDAQAVLHTREGQHVRFMLALIYFGEFKDLSPSDRRSVPAQNLAEKARSLFAALEHSGEFAAPAKAMKFEVLRAAGQIAARPIAELKTFDDCLLRARLALQDALDLAEELAQAEDDKAREALQARIKAHYETVRDAMRRGLLLVPEDVSEDDWEMGHQLLYLGYLRTGDPLRAAVAMEALARRARKPDSARRYAAEAIGLYRSLAAQSRSAADADRLVALARWLEANHPDSLETDTARAALGFIFLQRNQPREAAAVWERVSPRSPSYAEFQYRAGIISWSQHILAMREKQQPIQTPTPERDKAIQLLERSITSFEASAKIHELDQNPTDQDRAKAAADLRMSIKAKLVLADIYNYLGETDRVLALVSPLVEAIKSKKLPEDLPPDSEAQALGLALRAHVAKKDIQQALAVLAILQQLGSQEGNLVGLTDLLRDLGRQIKNQIDLLQQQGEGAREQLAKTQESFREFLGHLEKDENLSADLRLWVGTSYMSLGEHKKAEQLFRRFRDPGPNAAPQERQMFNQSQYLLVRSARLAAASLTNPTQRRAEFANAEQLLKEVMKNPSFGKHPAFLAEEALLLQDQERYSGPDGAIAKWDRLIKGLEPMLDRGPVFRNTYNEALYNRVYCIYMEGKLSKDKTVQSQAVEKAARALNPIKRNNWGGPEYQARYEALLNNPKHKDLKEAFERLQRELQ